MDYPELGYYGTYRGWRSTPTDLVLSIVAAAKDAATSVPYKVSLRWVFYRLWQEGVLAHVPETPNASKKVNAYNRLKAYCSKAVHTNLLKPDWVADETRNIGGAGGYHSVEEWVEALKDDRCYLDRMLGQEKYVMVAFEAEAMAQQFDHYAGPYGCKLMPMRGDPSNPYKHRIVQMIRWIDHSLSMPVVVIYFGDLDRKGMTIPETAFFDVRSWCDVEFESYRIGLNEGDEITYNIPEIPGKPGAYQWEALDDDQAGEMITTAIEEFVDMDQIEAIKEEEDEATTAVHEVLGELDWKD